jgi:hypothetical protein
VSTLLAPAVAIACVVMLVPVLRSDAADTLQLETAEEFAVLAGSAITNTGATTIVGDVGSSPVPAITGFGTVALTGTNHGGDATTVQAKVDLAAAYAAAAANVPTAIIGSELGGTTLTPGVYASAAGTLAITGSLLLDSQGDPNAVFILQAASTLTTAAASSVSLVNGGSACNVFWQVGSSATLGAGTQLVGSILALTSITSGAGSSIDGRLLAQGGAVTLDSNSIIVPACTPPVTTTTEPPTTTTTEPPTTTTTEQPTTTTTEPPTTTTTEPPTTTTTEPPTTTTTEPPTTTTTDVAAVTTTTTSDPPPSAPDPPGAGTSPEVDAASVAAPVVSESSHGSAMAPTGSRKFALGLGAAALAAGLVLVAATRGSGVRRASGSMHRD